MLIKTLYQESINEIVNCLTEVKTACSKDIFIIPTKEYIEKILDGYGRVFGAFYDNRLIGFASVVFPKNGKHNLGTLLNLDKEELNKVVQFEHIAVLPEFQNIGLGSILLDTIIKEYKDSYDYLISTISPKNIKSLSLAFDFEQQIIKQLNVYGVDRYVMLRNLNKRFTICNSITIDIYNTAKIIDLLNNGYCGISFNEKKTAIVFARGYYEKI